LPQTAGALQGHTEMATDSPYRREGMRILHLGTAASPEVVDGVNSVVWTLAAEQSRLGHRVAFLMGGNRPLLETEILCKELSIEVFWVPANVLTYHLGALQRVLAAFRPDVVHRHSIFILKQAVLSYFLRWKGVPYVISPHGGCSSNVLGRKRWKKWPYGLLLEKPRFRHAAAIIPITEQERRDARAYAGSRGRVSAPVANPVSIPSEASWTGGEEGRGTVVFLARYAVRHKGLDRLVEIARRLPGVDFRVHGEGDSNRELSEVRALAPENLSFLPPVYGAEKWEVLRSAALYLQTSRWEALSISTAEALAVGLPCAVLPGDEDLRETLAREEAGFALSGDAEQAAAELKQILADGELRRRRGAAGARYAREHWSATSVAKAIVSRYEEAI